MTIYETSAQGFSLAQLCGHQVSNFVSAQIPKECKVISRLTSFSNANYLIEDSNRSNYVLRIPNIISRQLISQDHEYATLKWAKHTKLSKIKVLAYDLREGYLLTRFIQGKSCNQESFRDLALLQKAIELLQNLHCTELSPIHASFNPLTRYQVSCEFTSIPLNAKIHKLALQLDRFWKIRQKELFFHTPCHNDPSPENFFLHKDRLYLHDWELSSINDPMWDLSHFSVLCNVDKDTILEFYKTQDAHAKDKLIFFEPYIYFNSVVWASIEMKSDAPALPISVVKHLYTSFLDKINTCLQSPEFKESIYNLTAGE